MNPPVASNGATHQKAFAKTVGVPPKAPMRLVIGCRMRDLRNGRRLTDIAEVTGVSAGSLSQIERMERIPSPRHVQGLERAYGPSDRWYAVRLEAGE